MTPSGFMPALLEGKAWLFFFFRSADQSRVLVPTGRHLILIHKLTLATYKHPHTHTHN